MVCFLNISQIICPCRIYTGYPVFAVNTVHAAINNMHIG